MRGRIGLGAFIAGPVSGGWIVWLCWPLFFAPDPGDPMHWSMGAKPTDALTKLCLMLVVAVACGIAFCMLALSTQLHGRPALAIVLAILGYFVAVPRLIVKIFAISERM